MPQTQNTIPLGNPKIRCASCGTQLRRRVRTLTSHGYLLDLKRRPCFHIRPQRRRCICIHRIGVCFCVVVQQPFLPGQLDRCRVRLDLIEISFMPLISHRFSCLLSCPNPVVSNLLVCAYSPRNVYLPSQLQADRQCHPVFHRLRRALNRCR